MSYLGKTYEEFGSAKISIFCSAVHKADVQSGLEACSVYGRFSNVLKYDKAVPKTIC